MKFGKQVYLAVGTKLGLTRLTLLEGSRSLKLRAIIVTIYVAIWAVVLTVKGACGPCVSSFMHCHFGVFYTVIIFFLSEAYSFKALVKYTFLSASQFSIRIISI